MSTRLNALPALVLASLLALAGCASTGRFVSDWGEITLAPGDTGTCHSNPCRVFFEMPPGDDSYRLTGTGFTIGDYPAGKTVMIGSFFESTAIRVDDAGVPPTYLYVPSTTSDVD